MVDLVLHLEGTDSVEVPFWDNILPFSIVLAAAGTGAVLGYKIGAFAWRSAATWTSTA
jgi:hypothetical protein